MKSTLEELEKDCWDEPKFHSHLVTECHRLRKVPLNQFTTENLRIMLGQKISVKHLLPLAIEVLEKNPLADGDFYPGDLLKSVLSLPKEEWKKNNECLKRAIIITKEIGEIPKELNDAIKNFREINA